MVPKISILAVLAFLLSGPSAQAQETPPVKKDPPIVVEDQLENLTEANEDMVSEDDSWLQEMSQFLKEPLNLNYADQDQLKQLKILTPLQISNLLVYRKNFGNLLHIYELQAIPFWDIYTIRQLLPYITVSQKYNVVNSFSSRLKGGNHNLMFRGTQVLQKSKGYLPESRGGQNFYPGSAQKLLLRYKYKFKNTFQYGFTAEKDAGEQFFKGAQSQGFDFYSAHLFAKNIGIIKSLAIGDYSLNLGQGLVSWQSLSFNKGAEILNIKRQSEIIRPYNSAGEIEFHRGAAITLKKKQWESTLFTSFKKVDAGFQTDTLTLEEHVSSLQLSGLHRTANEIAAKNAQKQFAAGGNIQYGNTRFHIGANAILYSFVHTISKKEVLYNQFALGGNHLNNYSLDYSFTFKNMHFFGEAATDHNLNKALINGMAISAHSRVDLSFLYRHISRAYQSLYASAFTENTRPNNERGFYSGITITPSDRIKITAYADFFYFPWLKYRTDAPTTGTDYMIQLLYKPDRKVELYTRYKIKNKPINDNFFGDPLNPVMTKSKQSLRTQFVFKPSAVLTFRSRVELTWYDKRGINPEQGFMMYADLQYKPPLKAYGGNARIAYFETDGYNSRLYAFENDVLFAYSIPVFFDKGYRNYINLKYDISRKVTVWTRLAHTFYPGKEKIGSGLDEILGNKKSELKFQIIYDF